MSVARRVYAAACGVGALGLLLLAMAPDAISGSAGVLLVSGIAWTVTRTVGAIWVNGQATNEVRATVQSFLAQAEYIGEISCGVALALLAQTQSIGVALMGASVLVVCTGLMVATGLVARQ